MKLGRTTKIRQNFFFYHLSPFSSFRTTKIRQNFFVPSAHSIILDTSVSSLHGSTRLSVSLSSSVSAFDSILANRSSTAQPVLQVSLYSFLRIAPPLRLPPSIHPSTSSCCFDILSTTVSLFVLGPLGCAVYPMLTVGLTCTQLSRPLFSGCATYPMLVVGVTCTLSSRSFI